MTTKKHGYHIQDIPRGVIGEPSKIIEEAHEVADAHQQGVNIMTAVELSDLIGAVDRFREKHLPHISWDDLFKMYRVTRRAFESGARVERAVDVQGRHEADTQAEQVEETTAAEKLVSSQLSHSDIEEIAAEVVQQHTASLAAQLPQAPDINWSYIDDARDYYVALGFKKVSVPWIVSKAAVEPYASVSPQAFGGYLIGSAEQGFLQLILDGNLGRGGSVSVSPCFRNDVEDETHFKYFQKVELFNLIGFDLLAISVERKMLEIEEVMNDAYKFFDKKLNEALGSTYTTLVDGYKEYCSLDIVFDGHESADIILTCLEPGRYTNWELGSYSYREFSFTDSSGQLRVAHYVCGTGLAEPRFSQAIKAIKSFALEYRRKERL